MLICTHFSYGRSDLDPATAGSQLDAGLYTSYGLDPAQTVLSWIVCGSTGGSEGCYGAGNLGPFGKIGALLEGKPKTDVTTNTVTRAIYVLDVASGSNRIGVTLFVYTKTDMIAAGFDTVDVILAKTVSLPIAGGATARASMAANSRFLYLGTNQSPLGVKVEKRILSVTTFSEGSPSINVSAITADHAGFVTVTFGSFAGADNGNIVFGPDGTSQGDGGGAAFLLNTVQALLPSTLH
ncbi:MAG: hypothetical protein H0X34_11780 [Chthoniobacterales bacterium]|nr:hypothetical protein [Chthoniobacterales bacterium]